jgi:hypothetical protein
MTMTNNNFASRVMAAFFAVVLSATMLAGSVGPAYNGTASLSAQDHIA